MAIQKTALDHLTVAARSLTEAFGAATDAQCEAARAIILRAQTLCASAIEQLINPCDDTTITAPRLKFTLLPGGTAGVVSPHSFVPSHDWHEAPSFIDLGGES